MKIFSITMLVMFIGACTSVTSRDNKSAASNSNSAVENSTTSPENPSGVKVDSAKVNKEEERHEVPTINIVPEDEYEDSTTGTQVPEKE